MYIRDNANITACAGFRANKAWLRFISSWKLFGHMQCIVMSAEMEETFRTSLHSDYCQWKHSGNRFRRCATI